MRKMLGTRCPECGTTDAPAYAPADGVDMWTCPRCAYTEGDPRCMRDALRAFYGEGQEGQDPRPVCGIAPTLRKLSDGRCWYEARKHDALGLFEVCTEPCATESEARAAWNKLVGGEG